MTTIYQSRRGMMSVEQEGDILRARIDTERPRLDEQLLRTVEAANRSVEEGSASLPLTVVQAGNGKLEVTCELLGRPRFPRTQTCDWWLAEDTVAGLCILADELHRDPGGSLFLGPPSRELLFLGTVLDPRPIGSPDWGRAYCLCTPFAALHGFVHRIEAAMLGAAMMPGNFKITPEMRDNTPTADVFFLTQFLVELLTGREPYPGRYGNYIDYIEALRGGPAPIIDEWPEIAAATGCPPHIELVVKVGLSRDPEIRFPTPAELCDALYDL